MNTDLGSALKEFKNTLTAAEASNYKLILGLAAGGIAQNFNVPEQLSSKRTLNIVEECLLDLSPFKDRIPSDGIAWIGRPDFLSDELLASLIEESINLRPHATRFDNHYLGAGAPIANKFAISKELTDFVQEKAGRVIPTGVASFLYYDEDGCGIPPHIDTDIFSLNVILMLHHNHKDIENPSNLMVFPANEAPKKIKLIPGEIIIIFSGNIIHAREPVKKDESISIITFGFKPQQ